MPEQAGAVKQAALDLDNLLARIAEDYPELSFIESAHFSWHPGKRHVSYQKAKENAEHAMWALMHELGHALEGHTGYTHDIELLQLEVAAWEKARELAKHYSLKMDEDYIQDCLDSYRDWLHMRATCPGCFGRALQATAGSYRCFNCQAQWKVSRSRLCRPYRLQKA